MNRTTQKAPVETIDLTCQSMTNKYNLQLCIKMSVVKTVVCKITYFNNEVKIKSMGLQSKVISQNWAFIFLCNTAIS